jgi:hypothetical protein
LLRSAEVTGPFDPLAGRVDVPGTGALQTFADPNAGGVEFYRIEVKVP